MGCVAAVAALAQVLVARGDFQPQMGRAASLDVAAEFSSTPSSARRSMLG